jgi:AcrR family transcriptional regulator
MRLSPDAVNVRGRDMATPERRRYAPRMAPEDRREQLLDATLKLVSRHGFDAVTIHAVARDAGVTRPVIYDHFSDLADLLHALIDREEERALAQLASAIPTLEGRDADPDDLLLNGLGVFFAAVLHDPERWRFILAPAEGAPGFLRERIKRDRATILAQLEPLVAWALDTRGDLAGLEPELVARMLVSTAEEGARLILSEPERYPPERLLANTRALLAALRGAGGDGR